VPERIEGKIQQTPPELGVSRDVIADIEAERRKIEVPDLIMIAHRFTISIER